MSPSPLMRYDQESSSWRTCGDTSLWDLEMCSPIFPAWGMTHDGVLFERPTPEHLINAQDCSSFPTPAARDFKDHEVARARQRPESLDSLSRALTILLPTPAVNDMGAGKDPQVWDDWTKTMREAHGNGNGHGKSLEQEALRMLPTPRAQNGEERNQNIWQRDIKEPQNLENALARLGNNTSQPLDDGNASSTGQHPNQPSPAATANRDCLPFSWNG